eukprot:CAMPEP_0197941086 /NCGR_PEP_ID=MMETSP1439-20131203/122265_1 /TAXON_ID=66791 /ORGANISM="Gonyaulax spinifera, Strain CCMP409" /LENGTH=47 /DNA_ID= /DNA_START= /DNA_END= /DNA_ORIENTATION=
MEPQLEHRVGHVGEHRLGGRVDGQLDKSDRKDVDYRDEEAQGEEDGA